MYDKMILGQIHRHGNVNYEYVVRIFGPEGLMVICGADTTATVLALIIRIRKDKGTFIIYSRDTADKLMLYPKMIFHEQTKMGETK